MNGAITNLGTYFPDYDATSVRVLRNGSKLAAAAPVSPTSFLDATAAPGLLEYQLEFTMSGNPCPPLKLTFDAGITDLDAYRTQNLVRLQWPSNLTYDNIEVRRDGVLIDTIAGGNHHDYARR